MSWMRPNVTGNLPSARCAHATSSNSSSLFVFGGWNGQKMLNDLYILEQGETNNSGVWNKPDTMGNTPGIRAGHTMTIIPRKNQMFLFGGGDGTQYLSDLHILDLKTMAWSEAYVAGQPPAARSRHTSTLIGDKLFIFAGGDDLRVYNNLYVLDPEKMNWTRPLMKGELPEERWGHASVSVHEDSKLLVFGGHNGTKMVDDLWILEIETFTWIKVVPLNSSDGSGSPGVRAGHVICSFGKRVFVFGGSDGSKILNDVWVLDVSSQNYSEWQWIKPALSGNAPTPRCAHSVNPVGNKIMVFGGVSGQGETTKRLRELYSIDIDLLDSRIDEGKKPRSRRNAGTNNNNPVSKGEKRNESQDIVDVSGWLNELGLKQYLDKFTSEEVTIETLPYLTEDHLKELGVNTTGSRLKMLHSIKGMKQKKGEKQETVEWVQMIKGVSDQLEHLNTNLVELARVVHYNSSSSRSDKNRSKG
eukprot:TRINITY_DN288_c0_g1_i4.p1 TRINITY_DN288_c0_g1~~TRINITY_DN288_c0_g1_i4.p1  ORF type:complete len:489 (+),score=129.23 TRINITY_DN288_c0_g1_i4:54-1469(+)